MGWGASAWGRRLQRENVWVRESARQVVGVYLAQQMERTVEELKSCRDLLEDGQAKEE